MLPKDVRNRPFKSPAPVHDFFFEHVSILEHDWNTPHQKNDHMVVCESGIMGTKKDVKSCGTRIGF